MPLIPNSAVVIPQQVLPDGSPVYVNQMNTGQALGQIQFWNPDLSQPKLIGLLNNSLRKVVDRKAWASLFVKGQLISPQAVTQGQATTVLGSPIVRGTNTAWTEDLIGRQFRVGYNCPIYTITDCDPGAQTLTLELPWGATSTTSGYFIIQYYYNFGPNVKYLKCMLNVQLGYKFDLHWTQDGLNTKDAWREAQNFPYISAGMPLAPDGSYLQELYPASWIQQAFPFMCYIQPSNLVNDSDPFPPYFRSDIIIKDAIAEALVIGGPKNNKYYDAGESRNKRQDFEAELLQMARADENLYRTEVTKWGEDAPYYQGGGSLYDAQHAVSAGATRGGYEL